MQKVLLIVLSLIAIGCKTTKNTINSASIFEKEILTHREHYKADFIKDDRSPLNAEDMKNLRFYAPDKSYQCNCTFEGTPDSKPFNMATFSGITKSYKKYGIATCTVNKKQLSVNVYSSLRLMNIPGYEDYLFIPFKDFTNSETTYGGGRYIDISKKEIVDGKVEIDFNKCYNPWCAYSNGYNCPIPPTENHFEVEINAGEKMWVGKKKH